MRSPRDSWLLACLLIVMTGFMMSCGDDDPTDPADSTAPVVQSSDPANEAVGVARSDSIFVVFSEAMAATADGQVEMTPASNHGHTWYSNRRLAIGHDAWDEGVEVTVTLGTGLTDVAGNGLAEDHIFSFHVESHAPLVVSVDPEIDDVAVSLDDSVHVVFSEAMDPTSATGEITMTPASNHGHTWNTDRKLAIGHDAWPEGTEVTVTVGAGLTDVAGIPMAAPFTYSFTTVSTTELLLLDTTPAHNTTDVDRNAPILLHFSADINMSTLDANVSITDGPVADFYDFTATGLGEGVVLIDPDLTLPASTTFTVLIDPGIQTWGGLTLASPHAFNFTTGSDLDSTPPTVVSVEPANGSQNVPADVGFFRVTFSEPVNPDSFEPTRWSLAFYFLFETLNAGASWSEGGTVFTAPLPILPAGMPMEIHFGEVEDLAGNVQSTPYVYSAKVAGTADYTPVEDGRRWGVDSNWEAGIIGDNTPTNDGEDNWFTELEVLLDESYRLNRFVDSGFSIPEGWDAYRKAASAVQWLGFEEDNPPANKENFDSPLDILPLPITVGTWTDDTTVTIEGDGDYRATLTGEVLEQADYPIAESDGEVFIKDAWSVLRVLEVEYFVDPGWELTMTQIDTIWYAPTLGDVRISRYLEQYDENKWERRVTWNFPFYGMMKAGSATVPWR